MNANYKMNVEDVMNELGVKRSKTYAILKELNEDLVKEGYKSVRRKISCLYWETKFYSCSKNIMR